MGAFFSLSQFSISHCLMADLSEAYGFNVYDIILNDIRNATKYGRCIN